MYRVVGCRECGALWIVADRPETTRCPRCRTRHRFGALHAVYETEDEAAARRARAAVLAERAGHGEAFAELDDQLDGGFGTLTAADLEASGLDPEAIAAAGERAAAAPARSRAKRATVLDALEALDRPTEAEVVDYAADRNVPPEAVSDVLARLVRAGEVTESSGRYRPV